MSDAEPAAERIQQPGLEAYAVPDDADDEDGPLTVRGVALGEGPAQGTVSDEADEEDAPIIYSPEVLEAGADKLVGRPIVDDRDHDPNSDEYDPYNPNNENIIGEVTQAKAKPGVGVVYQGEVDRSPERDLIENGRVDVSPTVLRSADEYDDDLGGKPAKAIAHFRDLAVVPDGASPEASIEPATNPAEALQAEALAATFGGDDGHARARGGAKAASGETAAETMADSDNPDNPDDTPPEGSDGESGGEENSDGENADSELTSMSKDELVSEVEDLRADKNDMRETLAELKGQVKALGGDVEAMEAAIGGVEEHAVEAFAEKHDYDEEFVRENFDTATVIEAVGGPEATAEALGMTPNPQTGDGGGNSGNGSVASLGSDEQAEVEDLAARAETFENIDESHAEALREQAAEVAGAEEWSDIEAEVV
jgi:hypothetical protein